MGEYLRCRVCPRLCCCRARNELARIFSSIIQARRAAGKSVRDEHDMMQVKLVVSCSAYCTRPLLGVCLSAFQLAESLFKAEDKLASPGRQNQLAGTASL